MSKVARASIKRKYHFAIESSIVESVMALRLIPVETVA
jgi:hypothetical protein